MGGGVKLRSWGCHPASTSPALWLWASPSLGATSCPNLRGQGSAAQAEGESRHVREKLEPCGWGKEIVLVGGYEDTWCRFGGRDCVCATVGGVQCSSGREPNAVVEEGRVWVHGVAGRENLCGAEPGSHWITWCSPCNGWPPALKG